MKPFASLLFLSCLPMFNGLVLLVCVCVCVFWGEFRCKSKSWISLRLVLFYANYVELIASRTAIAIYVYLCSCPYAHSHLLCIYVCLFLICLLVGITFSSHFEIAGQQKQTKIYCDESNKQKQPTIITNKMSRKTTVDVIFLSTQRRTK